ADVVLRTDDPYAVALQVGELVLGRAAPEADVDVDADRLVVGRPGRALKPDGDREDVGVREEAPRGGTRRVGGRGGAARDRKGNEPDSHMHGMSSYGPVGKAGPRDLAVTQSA